MLLHRPGTPETMVPGTIEVPSPRQGELRVQVLACGLNPVDWKTARTGLPSWSWPHVLGQDIVGIITAIGPDGDTTDLGRLAIVQAPDDSYQVLPTKVAHKIAERGDVFVFIAEKTVQTVDEDDPYAAYQIPDDLMW